MTRHAALSAGTVVWVPCELKSGIFPTEHHVKIEVSASHTGDIFGFIPKEDVRPGEGSEQARVRGVVLRSTNGGHGKVKLLFRGDMLSASNPVIVPRDWLETVAEIEA